MYLIKEMPKQERPRERALEFGIEHLTNTELIAIILRTGSKELSVLKLSENILFEKESLLNLSNMPIEHLIQIKGIGPSKAIQLVAAFELGKRALQEHSKNQLVFTSPETIYSFLKNDVVHLTQEHFIALFFTNKGGLIKKETLFIGTLNKALIHPRVIFKKAVLYSAASFVVCHNHPSGDPTPSKADIEITNVISKNADLMDILFMDHIILGKNKYFSFKEKGML